MAPHPCQRHDSPLRAASLRKSLVGADGTLEKEDGSRGRHWEKRRELPNATSFIIRIRRALQELVDQVLLDDL